MRRNGKRWCFSPDSTMVTAGQGTKNKALELFLKSKNKQTRNFI
jgi:hypothetical protein